MKKLFISLILVALTMIPLTAFAEEPTLPTLTLPLQTVVNWLVQTIEANIVWIFIIVGVITVIYFILRALRRNASR